LVVSHDGPITLLTRHRTRRIQERLTTDVVVAYRELQLLLD
jgi:hypothetical protein